MTSSIHIKKIDFITGMIFTLLSIGTAISAAQLKTLPQIFLLILSFITLISFFSKNQALPTSLFYTLVLIMLYSNFFMLAAWLVDSIYPERGWVEVDGKKRKVMDMSWVWCVLCGLFFSPISLFVYHKVKMRNRAVEIIVTTIFVVLMAMILHKD